MDSKFTFSALLLFVCLSSAAQISLTAGQAPATAGTERLLGQRLKGIRNAGSSSDKEIYIGVPDLGVSANRSEGDFVYGSTMQFSLQFDPAANLFTSTISRTGATATVTKENISATASAAGKSNALFTMNFMELQIRTGNATSTIELSNLLLNGQSINGPLSQGSSAASSFWHLKDYDFGSGFTLSGTITLTGTFSNSAEANKIEISFGTQPSAAPVTLPLVWGDINVKKGASGINELSWITLQEENTESFLIQRSEDGRQFRTVGRRTAKGNSSTATSYSFQDAGFNGDAYYRIIQVDIDGKVGYSKIVGMKNKAVSSIFYNGTSGLVIQSTDSKPKNVRVVDANGRTYINTVIRDANAKVDVSQLSKGMYFVQLEGAEGPAYRFIKQ
ncbi:MAG TPA: T9SS type A sorting domain-containing protein [Flavisolibacter sp.]|nr:T9SS type A sorting domain-containing protein [Flavisolibacter sp.]